MTSATVTFLSFLACYTLSQFYRSFLAVIAPEIAKDLQLSATDLGAISAAWFIFFAIAQLPLGAALDRRGPRRTVPAFVAIGALGAVLFSLSQSGRTMFLAMGLIGVGCAPALMGALYVFGRTFPQDRFTLLSSLMIGLGSAGNLLGGTPLALAVKWTGWRNVMLVLAVLSSFAAFAIWKLVRDPPPVSPVEQSRNGWISALREVLALRSLWPILPLMGVGYPILIAERGLWVGPFFSDVYGLDAVWRGNMVLLMALAITIGAFTYGPLERRFRTHKWLALPGSAITGLTFLSLALFPGAGLAQATVALCLIGAAGMTYAVIVAHIRSFLPEHILGRGITFANFLCMGSAGAIQVASGRYVDRLTAAGLPESDVYAHLHGAFALVLLTATGIYTFSRDR